MDSIDKLGMNEILEASFGENGSKIRVSFKKTVQTANFESEVFMTDMELEYDKEVPGCGRQILLATAYAQSEFTILANLLSKGIITGNEYVEKRKVAEEYVNNVIEKCASIDYEMTMKIIEEMGRKRKA